MNTDFFPDKTFIGTYAGVYMPAAIPISTDFYHPRYAEIMRLFEIDFWFHRKNWEWAFIIEQLELEGVIARGKRGVGFGCGTEALPSYFAAKGCEVLATDAPAGSSGLDWTSGNQYAQSKADLFKPNVIKREDFDALVSFAPCDMNAVPDYEEKFDFCWSACCLEHLGSLQHGLDFFVNSVERCLKPGGIACHTTEFNISSNDETFESADLSLYRRQDIERLIATLTDRGHTVRPFTMGVGPAQLDFHVDYPPYHQDIAHIKLKMGNYVITSVGLVVERGK